MAVEPRRHCGFRKIGEDPGIDLTEGLDSSSDGGGTARTDGAAVAGGGGAHSGAAREEGPPDGRVHLDA